jgi:leucyl/phenylalanyl-tRNA--protein transferase
MGAWLGPQMINAYTQLHKMGIAHSVEVWETKETGNNTSIPRRLVGGLYGIDLNGAFFGESMFSLVPSASKLALIHLAQHLEKKGYSFIDCQFETPHLLSMGGRDITYEEYMSILNANAHKKE